jgi:hypothetical protein
MITYYKNGRYSNRQRSRLHFAITCLKLAQDEYRKFKREFMKPGETVYHSAIDYSGKRLTLEEIKIVAKMNKQRRKALIRRNLQARRAKTQSNKTDRQRLNKELNYDTRD